MRILLTILVFIFAPVLTEQGLQIGEININNQKIKIMKMNLNNPAFLQMAGNAGISECVVLRYSTQDQSAIVSCLGDLTVSSIKNGIAHEEHFSNLNNFAITFNSDENRDIILYGRITSLSGGNGPYRFEELNYISVKNAKSLTSLDCSRSQISSLDVSKNTALTSLSCSGTQISSLDVSKNTALTSLICSSTQISSLDVTQNTALTSLNCSSTQISSLDVSKNTALTSLNCSSVPNITNISAHLRTSVIANNVAAAIQSAISEDGTLEVYGQYGYNATATNVATEKGWTVEYVDAA